MLMCTQYKKKIGACQGSYFFFSSKFISTVYEKLCRYKSLHVISYLFDLDRIAIEYDMAIKPKVSLSFVPISGVTSVPSPIIWAGSE